MKINLMRSVHIGALRRTDDVVDTTKLPEGGTVEEWGGGFIITANGVRSELRACLVASVDRPVTSQGDHRDDGDKEAVSGVVAKAEGRKTRGGIEDTRGEDHPPGSAAAEAQRLIDHKAKAARRKG